jgi:hypothetical protein
LLRHFRSLGFARVLDRVDFLPTVRRSRSRMKQIGLAAATRLPPVKVAARAVASGNYFLCVK